MEERALPLHAWRTRPRHRRLALDGPLPMRTRVVAVPALTAALALALALALAGLLAPRASLAACTGVGLFSCSATVSATSLAFDNYDPAVPTPTDSASTVNVTAAVTGVGILVTLSYTVGLSAGSVGTIANRQMNGPGTTPLAYNLYTTNARGTVWDSSNVSDSYSALATLGGTIVPRSYTVYGRIPPGQYVAPGSYGSTITVTETY